ncbi:hypothetical protein AVEN_148369-1 [Araneus ventricosus]|uniref:Uncharacterized protein n=1 Tax=Araneus ventricosus TaxID=182803 RepID=A0A4Y2QI08_ARAVE|nr:hypothetical protein AVEN_148369-1 [Araneus ventricosus]
MLDCLLESDRFGLEDCVVISQLGRLSINYVLALKNTESDPYSLYCFGTIGINSSICSAGSAVLKRSLVWLRVFGRVRCPSSFLFFDFFWLKCGELWRKWGS